MASRIDLFDNTYSNFSEQVLQAIREETFGRGIGQNSWLTADEYDRFISWLNLLPGDHALEVASGCGGPARYRACKANRSLARCARTSPRALIRIEGEDRFHGLQKFFAAVHRLTSERRLSRIVYLVERPNKN